MNKVCIRRLQAPPKPVSFRSEQNALKSKILISVGGKPTDRKKSAQPMKNIRLTKPQASERGYLCRIVPNLKFFVPSRQYFGIIKIIL